MTAKDKPKYVMNLRPQPKTADENNGEPGIEMSRWGKDHWSVFAYIESLCVDYPDGIARPDRRRMQTNPARHPGLVGVMTVGTVLDATEYGIRLAGGKELPGAYYDEWDCIDDLEWYGLVRSMGTGINPEYRMTEKGMCMAAQLRTHKANGGQYANFTPDLEADK